MDKTLVQQIRSVEPRRGYAGAPAYSEYLAATAEPNALLEYWRIIHGHKGAVITIALLGLVVALLITLPQTPVYQARTTIEVQDLNQEFMNLKQVSPVSEDSGVNALNDMQTQIKILQSALLADRTLAKLKITPDSLNLPQSRLWQWMRALTLATAPNTPSRQAMLRAFADNLKVRAAGQTRIIEVLVDSTDPKTAAAFANTLASEYIDQNIEARWQMSQRTGDWLSRQLEDMRIKLEHSEDALQSYARRNNLLFTQGTQGSSQNVTEEKLHQLQTEFSKAEADRVSAQSR